MRKTTTYRILLALALALILAGQLLLDGGAAPPAAQTPSEPTDPLDLAAEVGLNQAWYIAQGYADETVDLPPIAPAHFPSPTPPAQVQLSGDFEHQVFLPLIQDMKMVEARALWVTRWDYSSADDVKTLVANAAGAGFNIILFQVRGNADAFYTPGLEPWAARLSESGTLGEHPGWDPLQTAADAARAHGVELHAYINVYPVWMRSEGDDPDKMAPLDSAQPQHLFWTLSHKYGTWNWRIADNAGDPMSLYGRGYLWPTPALDDIDDRVVGVTADLVTRYDIDGIHLDLVRYPGRDYSYDVFTNDALAASGLRRDDWQRQRVTELVSRVYSQVILPRPGMRLSAAVWPVYINHWGLKDSQDLPFTQGYSDFYQDSQGWMKGGVIDAIMPMIYPADVLASPDRFTTEQFALLTADFLNNDGDRHVFPGISAQYDNFDQIAQRIAVARDLGAPGHAIFSAGLVTGNYTCGERTPCHDPYWDDFAAGPYARAARVPPMSWRP
ncbi:MAG: glycoside hydrolase family 10 protein [Chloroflexota bacterium]